MYGRTCKKYRNKVEMENTLGYPTIPNMAKKKDKEDYTTSVVQHIVATKVFLFLHV